MIAVVGPAHLASPSGVIDGVFARHIASVIGQLIQLAGQPASCAADPRRAGKLWQEFVDRRGCSWCVSDHANI